MKRALPCLLTLSLLFIPALGFADVIGPDQEACTNKKAGDACKVGDQDGACVKGQRCRPLPDGESSCSDIIRCEAGATPKADEPKPDAPKEDPKTDETKDDKKDPTTPADTTPPTTDKPKQGSCTSVVHEAPGHGLWFVLGVGLLVGLRRRKD